ncbi:MAG TPA: MucB/RseB C-terminal domain-containing protein [Burkholderiales bacterium]|nr:MucB/RseB C-terminal domain-containing protein [Burkholderiales bacterium]
MTLRATLAAVCVALAGAAHSQSPETLAWLKKIQDASRSLSYTGTFVYQQGGRTETSRITRLAEGDVERLEVLDGMPREIVRTRDTLRCYLPQSGVVKVERRTADRSFPRLLPEQVGMLTEHYDIRLGGKERVGGFECQAVVLVPKDDLRYGYRLYADVNSGMLVRATTVDAAGSMVEQFTFTQLTIGRVSPSMVKPRNASRPWRVEDADAVPAHLEGWSVNPELPGFQKVGELKRRMGESRPVGQLVYSDGLAAVSVFIEPLRPGADAAPGLASLGAIHIYTREVANHRITVVGEAPATSVQRIADAVEYRSPVVEHAPR